MDTRPSYFWGWTGIWTNCGNAFLPHEKGCPIETARYIRIHTIDESRHGLHILWSKKILKQANRLIRCMSIYHNIDWLMCIKKYHEISIRQLSRNKQMEKRKSRIKFSIRVSNSVRDALLFDWQNENNLWGDAFKKEIAAFGQCTGLQLQTRPLLHQLFKQWQWQYYKPLLWNTTSRSSLEILQILFPSNS